ncbi:MAG: sigma-70 family RNA polymerase sigma factor [Pirellulales bacterium]|nr:sigma-70 family RNA polymerase sigma factor [Pirellulales bacterium]
MSSIDDSEIQRRNRFLELFLTHQSRIFRFIVSVVPRWVEAEELFQQTSLTLWQQWDEYDPALDFTAWACGIAKNHLRNYVRKKGNQCIFLGDEFLEQFAALQIEQQSYFDDLQSALDRCLERLSPLRRRLVHRHYGEKETIQAIAAREGRTPNAIYKLMRNIRKSLFDCVTAAVNSG